ncbi:ATP-binding protein [Ideonella sp.]|uniref:ATP-binding protein n=1 Tax=Ideonella sp. TaxID=1929293 RepID=UPI003BB7B04C
MAATASPAGMRQSLMRKLPTGWMAAALGSGLLLAVLLALAALAWYEHAEHIERVSDRNALSARVLADSATRSVEGASLATATLAELLGRGLASDGPELRTAMAQTLVNLSFLRGISILDAAAQVVSSTQRGEVGQVIDLNRLGALPAVGQASIGTAVVGRQLSDLTRDRAGASIPAGVAFLPVMRTVRLPDGSAVTLVALLNTAAFSNFQQLTLDDTDAAAALMSYDGRLIAATAGVDRVEGDSLGGLPPFTRFLPRIEHARWIGEGLRGGSQIAAFRVSNSQPLVVMVEFGHDTATRQWLSNMRGLFAAGVAATVFIALMTIMATRSVRAREVARAALDLAQRAVVDRERELSITIESLQELIFRTDDQGIITFVNHRWVTMTGDAEEDFLGEHAWSLVEPAQQGLVQALFRRDGKLGARSAQAWSERGGQRRCFEISVMPLLEHERLVGFAGSAVDLSERVEAQQRLQAQLSFTELLMEISPLPTTVTDLAGRQVRVNQAWERLTGLTRDSVVGKLAGTELSVRHRAQMQSADAKLLKHQEALRFETTLLDAQGVARDIIVNKVILPGADRVPSGILSLYVDVTEFRNAERATQEARDSAEEASRAKSEFVANMSHELRTPLQSIIGFSELGLMRSKDQLRLAGMFQDIHASGQRMLALVNDLLDVAKIESTVGTIHLERIDLRGLIREVLREVEPLLSARQLHIELQLSELPMVAKVDPQRFQQVIRNVLANAIKFSPAGGVIELQALHSHEGELLIRVSDQGPGVPPAELEHIFEAFMQSSRTKDGSGGTGLGLAICRKIVDVFGGRIHAQNRPQGGALFEIVLPARGASETRPMPF